MLLLVLSLQCLVQCTITRGYLDHDVLRLKRQANKDIKRIKVINFSDDNDHQPDDDGEYTHATLRNPERSFPSSFSICMSFMVEAWQDNSPSAHLFSIAGKDGKLWSYVYYGFKEWRVKIGKVNFFLKLMSCGSLSIGFICVCPSTLT